MILIKVKLTDGNSMTLIYHPEYDGHLDNYKNSPYWEVIEVPDEDTITESNTNNTKEES